MLSAGKLAAAVLTRGVSTIAIGATVSLSAINPVQAVTFHISWTGQILGYSAEGRFSYDETGDYKEGTVKTSLKTLQ